MRSHISALGILVCTISILLSSSVFAIEVPCKTGRKIFPHTVKTEAPFPAPRLYDTNTDNHFRSSSKIVGIGIPGVLILGCVFMCPCFQRKKKEDTSAIFQKELTSVDLSSSFEGNSNPKKVPATPPRRPPSPSASRYPPPSPSWSHHPPPSPRHPMPQKLNRFGSVHLNFSQISKATHSFSTSFKIGEGGFGTVYKAQLPSGLWIAVKRAKKKNKSSIEM